MRITKCFTREILDSRGIPTLEIVLESSAYSARASVPSGKSTGTREAHEKRDADGRGVSEARRLIEAEVAPRLAAHDVNSLSELDRFLTELDGTPNKERLGANTTLAISIAGTRLFAAERNVPLWKYLSKENDSTPAFPRLFMNMLNGGAHANFSLPFQEYIVIGEGSPRKAYDDLMVTFWALGEVLRYAAGKVPLGDEGGYAPVFKALEPPFEGLARIIERKKNLSLGIDAAASELYADEAYTLLGKRYAREELLSVYQNLANRYNLASIEDPFSENDHEGFRSAMASLGTRVHIIGDDLTVTNERYVHEAVAGREVNGIIVKPNQVGTVSETLKAAAAAREGGCILIASHRSGETEDTFISDLAVGIAAYGIKAGAGTQKERVAKYNRLLEIECEFA